MSINGLKKLYKLKFKTVNVLAELKKNLKIINILLNFVLVSKLKGES
jgi:hypothetical protein